jgi:hypothetical protein
LFDRRLQGRCQVIDSWQVFRTYLAEDKIIFFTTWERRQAMAGIRWEKDFSAARERAKAAKKPIYLDFWFDG